MSTCNWLTIGNIRISIYYAQNPPRTLLRSQLMSHFLSINLPCFLGILLVTLHILQCEHTWALRIVLQLSTHHTLRHHKM